MRHHIAFSFRTCSYGQLIYQQGATGDYLRMALTINGSFEMSWKVDDVVDAVTIGRDSLRNNEWYTIDSNFIQGEIHLSIEQGSVTKFQTLVSNSTFRSDLWHLNLTAGSRVQVGAGFSGCIQEGPSLKLSAADTDAENVLWGQCPLELRTVEGCGRWTVLTLFCCTLGLTITLFGLKFLTGLTWLVIEVIVCSARAIVTGCLRGNEASTACT